MPHPQGAWCLILRRANGRFVKILERAMSRYGAKQLQAKYEDTYDETYYFTVERWG